MQKRRSAEETPPSSSPYQGEDRRGKTSELPSFRASTPIDIRLYLITDRRLFTSHGSQFTAVEDALKGGLKAVQLREKDLGPRDLLNMAYMMRDLTEQYNARLFINDRVDIALAVKADGVHLGQNSIPVHAVRKISGNKLLIGVSTHSIDEAIEAEKDGADFITLGPIYRTLSKLKYGKPIGINILKEVRAVVSIPIFAIGGIKLDKVEEITEAGADGVALISAILTAKNIKETTEEFMRLLK
ncbi:MAG: thiamine phosphate synthase [Nitrospirota bacterium]|nr:thiamine phosphate synthase [Nitrospirota bacterium]